MGTEHNPAGYRITEVSDALAMHPQTLRKYERAGLVRPRRRSGGSRHYTSSDLERLSLIKHLADTRRINVAGMMLVLSLHDEVTALLGALEAMDAGAAACAAREHAQFMLALIREQR